MTESPDIRFLLAIKQSGSLVQAARKMELSPSAVTQRLQQLEKKLSVRLIDRTARRLVFTEEGRILCEQGARLMAELDQLSETLQSHREQMVGSLAINAPLGFGRRFIAPAVADFQKAYPDISLSLTLSDQPLVEAANPFDVVVHIGDLPVTNLVAYTLAPNQRFVCGAPSLMKRLTKPQEPNDLSKLPCIVLRENLEDVTLWQFKKGRTSRSVRIAPQLVCNDGDVIRQWACEGRGIILRSEWDVADDLAQGRLVRLLPEWKTSDANVVALTHHRIGQPARTRHFLKYLQDRFKPVAPWRKSTSTP